RADTRRTSAWAGRTPQTASASAEHPRKCSARDVPPELAKGGTVGAKSSSMSSRLSLIPDTSGQDRVVQPTPPGSRRRLALIAGAALVALILALPMVLRWVGAERSVAADRLRFATVERGTLVRDAPVQGRVVAAVSPT